MGQRKHTQLAWQALLAASATLLLLVTGCSMQDFGAMGGVSEVLSDPNAQASAQSEVRSDQLARMLMAAKQQPQSPQDEEYPIGPEDVLEISVFALERPGQPSILSRRVNVNGMINLPFVGDLHVSQLTARQAIKAVTAAYEDTYLKNPQVDVTVTDFRSAPVVVTGAVKQPGVYFLRRRSSTILDMLSLANGLAPEAGNELLIVRADPEPPVDATSDTTAATNTTSTAAESEPTTVTIQPDAPTIAPTSPEDTSPKLTLWSRRPKAQPAPETTVAAPDTDEDPKPKRQRKSRAKKETPAPEVAPPAEPESPPAPVPPGDDDAYSLVPDSIPNASDQMISIDLRRLLDAGDIRLNAPVRGGDVITVPPRKTQYVYVLGYVQRPGALEVRSDENLQALQAVAMAGGLSGSARAQNSTLITEKDGLRQTLPVDLTSMKRGKAPPAYLKPGDILIVGSSSLAKFAEFIKLSAGASYSPVP